MTPYTVSSRPFQCFSTAMLVKVAVRNPKGKLLPEVDRALQAELAVRRLAERRQVS